MRDLSAPTRKRLAALGAVRARSSSRSAAAADLDLGADDLSSGEVPPLRAQYGSGSPQASGEAADEGDGTFDAGTLEMTGSNSLHQRGSAVRGWEGLTDPRQLSVGSRTGSAVRFVSHVRSESGSQYPLGGFH